MAALYSEMPGGIIMPCLKGLQGNWSLEEMLKTIRLNTEQYNVDVTYAEYFLAGRPLDIFNMAISEQINNYVENFIDNARNLVAPIGKIPELKGEHTTYMALDRYISIKIDFLTFFGGSHSSHDILTITYDTIENAVINLTDFLGTGDNKLEQLSLLTEKELFDKYPELGFAFNSSTYRSGFAPKQENYKYWVLTDNGVIFFFPEYQIAPYAAGTLNVEIPFTSI